MDEWVRIKGQSHIVLVTWWQICAVGLTLLAVGAGIAYWRKSTLARALGAVGLVIGLAILIGGIALRIRAHR
jgi:hypothetical protein